MNENYNRLYKEIANKYKKVPQKKQLELLKLYKKTKNEKYLYQILYANLPLIVDIANSFNRNGENQDFLNDFISVGFEEGIKCLDRYDFNKGNCTVTSWVRNNVRNKIWTFLREHKKVVKINTSAYDKLTEDKKNRQKFFAKNGFFPQKGNMLITDNGEVYKFKNEYEFNVSDGTNENGEDILFKYIPDYDEDAFIPDENILKNRINNLAKEILTPIEYMIIDLHYNNKIKMTDINLHICPQNKDHIENIVKTGKNVLKILINGKKYIYNLYYSIFFNEENIKRLPLGKQMFKNKRILNYKNIYVNNNSLELCFDSRDDVQIYLNNKEIKYEIKNENKRFNIYIGKCGTVISKMHVHNLHENAIKKLRSYLLTYKIQSYE